MNKKLQCRFGAKLAFLIVASPLMANAQQYFTATGVGDVDAGFRKTGSFAEQYELVAYLGNISNFMTMPAGTTTNFISYTNQLIATMCPNGLGNLQWSAFATFSQDKPLTNSGLVWPYPTCWYTLPRANVSVQTTPPNRSPFSTEGNLEGSIYGISSGANILSQTLASPGQQGNTNVDNDFALILEPTADASDNNELTFYIGDKEGLGSAFGDFGGLTIDYSVENVTSNSFTAPVVSDFYVNVPTGRGATGPDPLTGTTSGNCDYLGYFTLNPNGVLSFTRAAAVVAPSVSSVTASATNGFGPLTVAFSDTTSGSATNWVWNFGNGVIITNTTAGNVTNVYTLAGSYTVTLTVYGPGGSSTDTIANFIVTSPAPKISLMTSSGQMVFSGVNCPAGVQYRILNSTNILTQLTNWKPIYTNTFSSNGTFSYTNTVGSGKSSFFIMVSP